MKNIKYNKFWLLLVLVAFVMGACEDDYDAPGSEPSHVFITSSNDRYENKVQVFDTLTLSTISRGVVKAEWKFPEGLVDIIDAADDVSSAQKTVKAAFNKPGEYNVVLHQEFLDNVWVGDQQKAEAYYDTTIVVTVLDSVKADFSALAVKDGLTLVNASNAAETAPNNTVFAGREILFSQDCVGEPDAFSWIFTNNKGYNKVYTDEIASVKFSSVGVYNMTLIASSPFGADTIFYENYVNIVASTDPVELLEVNSENGKIELVFSRDMTDPVEVDPTSFSLNVTNGDNSYDVAVSNLSLKSGAENVVVLELSADIYNSDIITVSYDAEVGDLITSDGMLADTFNDVSVFFIKPNILTTTTFDYGIENSTIANWPYDWWGGVWGMYTMSISDAQAHTGSKSAYIEMEAGGGAIFKHKDDAGNEHTFPAVAGKTYEIGFWVYVTELGDGTSVPDFRFYWSPNTNWGVGPAAAFTSNFATGKWVYGSTRVEFSADGDYGFMIRGWNEQNSQAFKFYFDDISVSELEIRPLN